LAGYYQAASGSSSCEACELDTYSASSGSTSCTSCGVDGYTDEIGSASCLSSVKATPPNPNDLGSGMTVASVSAIGAALLGIILFGAAVHSWRQRMAHKQQSLDPSWGQSKKAAIDVDDDFATGKKLEGAKFAAATSQGVKAVEGHQRGKKGTRSPSSNRTQPAKGTKQLGKLRVSREDYVATKTSTLKSPRGGAGGGEASLLSLREGGPVDDFADAAITVIKSHQAYELDSNGAVL
jgi:hypothetical protein